VPFRAEQVGGKIGDERVKERIMPLLRRAGPLTLDQIALELGDPHPRTLRSWLADLRHEGRVRQSFDGRTGANGRLYTYSVAPAYAPLPGMRGTEYRQPMATGTRPEAIRRLFRLE
jgi:DNA-binding transcriptional ArsR family regulator